MFMILKKKKKQQIYNSLIAKAHLICRVLFRNRDRYSVLDANCRNLCSFLKVITGIFKMEQTLTQRALIDLFRDIKYQSIINK